MVKQIRHSWPQVKIILRADSGFCRDALMSWCEANQVDYVFGFARNERLRRIIEPQMQEAAALYQHTSQAARVFTEFVYETNASWSRARRVVAKAEQLAGKENPRYVVTSLAATDWPAQKLYEELYCARGDMENRIKEQYSLFAGRVSAATLRANQLRLYLSAAAYVLMSAFRRLAFPPPPGRAHNARLSACNYSASAPRCASPLARSGYQSPAAIHIGKPSRMPMLSCAAELNGNTAL